MPTTDERDRLILKNIEDTQSVYTKTMEVAELVITNSWVAEAGSIAGLLDTAIRALEHVGAMAKALKDNTEPATKGE